MTTVLYHNPKCSTSRKAVDLLTEKGVAFEVVEYLKAGWDEATLDRLAAKTGLGIKGLLRKREARTGELIEAGASDAAIRAEMVANPVLVERPIVETDKGARIGRPLESVLEVL